MHLGGLYAGEVAASERFRGGQQAADAALAAFDVAGYAGSRNEVLPVSQRGASALSPYIRHGLLSLPTVWDAVAGGPARDVAKFRDELLWQEYARHLYGRLGGRTREPLRYRPVAPSAPGSPWRDDMPCVASAQEELERDGWLVNQARMWLASDWAVRHHADWRSGEDRFFAHLLDGSRAANRLGWQWTAGLLTGKVYGFSRYQVERRAPGLCTQCPLRDACPVEDWPAGVAMDAVDPDPLMRSDPDPIRTGGPTIPQVGGDADGVWLTAESLGDDDPALAARPDLPAVFVFDEPLLTRLAVSAKRLVFFAECLGDLAERRSVTVYRGAPSAVLRGRRPAVTFTPVPGWRRLAAQLEIAEVHPWRWLRFPHSGPVTSFSAWRRAFR
jgi:deoxyribodipyrimidine photo-lyase